MSVEISERLARIEIGQSLACDAVEDIQTAVGQVAVHEEKYIAMRQAVDSLWVQIDTAAAGQDTCIIRSLRIQLGWIWAFLASVLLLLFGLFINKFV